MADNTLETVLLVGGIGFGAYLLYQWMLEQAALATTTTTVTTPAGLIPSSTPAQSLTAAQMPVGQTVSSMLLRDTGYSATQTMDPYQWENVYTGQLGLQAPNPATFAAAFFPGGVPTSESAFPQVTAVQWATALGMSGLSGGYRRA